MYATAGKLLTFQYPKWHLKRYGSWNLTHSFLILEDKTRHKIFMPQYTPETIELMIHTSVQVTWVYIWSKVLLKPIKTAVLIESLEFKNVYQKFLLPTNSSKFHVILSNAVCNKIDVATLSLSDLSSCSTEKITLDDWFLESMITNGNAIALVTKVCKSFLQLQVRSPYGMFLFDAYGISPYFIKAQTYIALQCKTIRYGKKIIAINNVLSKVKSCTKCCCYQTDSCLTGCKIRKSKIINEPMYIDKIVVFDGSCKLYLSCHHGQYFSGWMNEKHPLFFYMCSFRNFDFFPITGYSFRVLWSGMRDNVDFYSHLIQIIDMTCMFSTIVRN